MQVWGFYPFFIRILSFFDQKLGIFLLVTDTLCVMTAIENEVNIGFPVAPATAVDAIDTLLAYAVKLHASDIHIDPRSKDILMRLRIDGSMETVGLLPQRLHEEMIARLKIMA